MNITAADAIIIKGIYLLMRKLIKPVWKWDHVEEWLREAESSGAIPKEWIEP